MADLFSPGHIGAVEIPNRIVMPSMTTRSADADGFVTDDTIAYFVARARGGTGLVTVEMASPEKAGRHRHHELGIYDDRFLPGLKRLVRAIRDAGARTAIQLGHGGGHTRRDICGETPVAPSAVPHTVFEHTMETIVPEAMNRARVVEAIDAFVAAAKRAQEAGFDCVEIHAAHGYLISQFLCPAENKRNDEYGGPLENRARFGLDILRGIKAEAPGVAVIFRLTVEDFFADGMPLRDGIQVAEWAAVSGADAVHVSAGHYRSEPPTMMIPPMAFPDAPFLDFAAQVKARVRVPVIAVGRLGDPNTARAAIADGKADFIALGRSLLADEAWPNKVRAGAPVRRCLACNSCINGMRGGDKLGCIVNPVAGRERDFANSKPRRGETIAVVGAGPAGLAYASLVAADNKVTVFERAEAAGGAFRLAGKAPLFQDVEAAEKSLLTHITSLEDMCREYGVTFRFNTDVTSIPDELAGFDRLVIATGADYRFGLGPFASRLLDRGGGRWPVFRKILSRPDIRHWFYYKARLGSGDRLRSLAHPGQKVTVIGDALTAGKTQEAVMSAFEAALHD
jgi:2,4-dienoyl-CoA reductase-like NADH-dependent reductase (Old Yellow Enzyme family)